MGRRRWPGERRTRIALCRSPAGRPADGTAIAVRAAQGGRGALLKHAEAGVHRSTLRRPLRAVVSGSTTALPISLDHGGVDVGREVELIVKGHDAASTQVQRLVYAFIESGTADTIVLRMAG